MLLSPSCKSLRSDVYALDMGSRCTAPVCPTAGPVRVLVCVRADGKPAVRARVRA